MEKAIKLNAVERRVFNRLKEMDHFKNYLKWWVDTACLSNRTKAEQRAITMNMLRRCARLMVCNPDIRAERIYGWYLALDGYRKPRNMKWT